MTTKLSPMSDDDMRDIIIKGAGGDDAGDLPSEFLDASFEDLGYDSLALIETAATLKRDHGVVISDEQIAEVRTPAELLLLINHWIGSAAVAGLPGR